MPSPIEITFAVRGMDEVEKALRSISDLASRVERRSAAAARAGMDTKQRQAQREAAERVRAWQQSERLAAAAQRAGARGVEGRFRAEARAARAAAAEQSQLASRVASARTQAEQHAAAQQRQLAARVATARTQAEQSAARRMASIRERSASMAGAHARKQAHAEAVVSRQIAAEQNKAHLEIRRGAVGAAPERTPEARLSMLSSAQGKPLDEQRAILAKARLARQEAQIDRSRHAKAINEEKAKQRDVTAEVERAEKNRASIRERSASMAGRLAARQAREEARARRQADAEAQRHRERFANTVMGAGSHAIRNATSIVGNVGRRFLGGIAHVGGGFSIEDSVQREVQLRGQAATLAASSQGGFTGAGLLASARKVADAQAMDPEAVLRGYDELKKLTGDMPKAIEVMPELAKIATASGADLGELSGLAGNIMAANEKITSDELLRQVRIFTQQGIVGGVEIGDFAKYGARIMAGATLFGGSKEENEAALGGMAQIARQRGGAASAAEATLAAQRFGTDVQKHAADLEKRGIQVSDGKGTMRSAEEIALDMLRKTDGDVTRLTKMGLGERGVRVLTGVADIYREAGGGETGIEAVKKEFAKYKEVLSAAEVEERNKQRLAEVDAQLTIAMNDLRTAVGTQLVPELTKLVPLISQATPHMARLLEGFIAIGTWAASHPFSTFAALVTKSFTEMLVAAQIGEAIKKVIGGAAGGVPVPGAGGGVPGAGGGGGGGRVPGAGGVVAGGAVAIGSAIQIGTMTDLADERVGAVLSGKLEASRLASDLRSGDAEKVAAAQREIANAKGQSSAADKAFSYVDSATRGALTVLSPFSYLATKASDFAAEKAGVQSGAQLSVQTLRANEIVNSEELRKAIAEATAAGVREGAAKGASSMGSSGVASPGDPRRGQSLPKRSAQ